MFHCPYPSRVLVMRASSQWQCLECSPPYPVFPRIIKKREIHCFHDISSLGNEPTPYIFDYHSVFEVVSRSIRKSLPNQPPSRNNYFFLVPSSNPRLNWRYRNSSITSGARRMSALSISFAPVSIIPSLSVSRFLMLTTYERITSA